MSDLGNVEKLKTTPITELNLGNARTRRVIKRAGFETLPEVFELSEDEIDGIFEWEEADALIRLKEKYLANPDAVAATVLQKREIDRAATERTLAEARLSCASVKTPKSTSVSCAYYPDDGPTDLPPMPFSEALRVYERRASEAFDDLDDRFEDVMVYQAFEEFSTDLDELSDAFTQLFSHYSVQPRAALGLVERHLRNAFVVYVADRSRNVYSDGNLWGNFFDGLGVSDGNVQALFKQTFVNHIERRGMPLYARDEEVNYYFYTALLHGGLSADSWANLWEKSILPLAKEIAAGHYGFGGEMDGPSILKELKNPESRFAPKKAVLNILEKAPNSTVTPLFEASMRVAVQVESAKKATGNFTMLSNYGLPEVAMEALRETQEQALVSGARSRSSESSREGSHVGQRLVYLPMASLQLDLAEGVVSIRWPRQQFPRYFAGSRIDYYVDGKRELVVDFDISIGKCILEASSIEVKPQARYDIEIKLMQRDDNTEEYVEVSSLHQTFTRSKPGCFEFIKDAKGFFRLRGRSERITRKRRVAYIVKEGHRIDPGQGMAPVSEYETSSRWDGAQIYVYDIDPGSSGAIVDTKTGNEIAVWQERYVAKIDKRRIIGETLDGMDLYGYVPCGLGTNGGLPSVTIEAIDGLSALNDLDIMCVCDGRRIAMPRHIVWDDDPGKSNTAQITLVPQESSLFDWHIEECLVEARQRSSGGKIVFRYRFAAVPIQDFRPLSVDFDYGVAVAEYGLQAMLAVDITNSQGDTEAVNAWERYSAKTLLKDEFLSLRIQSKDSGKKTDAKLALAAIDIEIPGALMNIAKKRPICLADALSLGPSSANFRITSSSWRYNRAVMVMLDCEPLFLEELRQPGVHEFNLFRCIAAFRQADESAPCARPLRLSLIYGDDVTRGYLRPAWTDVQLLDCFEGIGINDWKVLATTAGEHVLRFDGAPLCDVCFEFKRRLGGRVIAEVSAEEGSAEVVIPQSVVRLIDARKTVIIEMSPSDWFGDPQHEYATRFTLRR
ncbi:MAG: hypothetical protein HFJ66_00415 [Eggerthellaceae bacterium]|nr:hypothetical protein [Eggerthellaceae bacterium]